MKKAINFSWLVPLGMFLGCSTSNGVGASTGPSSAGEGNSSSNIGGSGSQYRVGTSGGTAGTGTGLPSLDSGCASDVTSAQLTQVNILFLLDKSGSMGNDPNGGWANADSRWNPVVTTLDAFFSDPNSSGLYASLSFLPADGDNNAICTVANYSSGNSSIKVPLTLLDAAGRQSFLSILCPPTGPQNPPCVVPAGGTPTLPALQGTIDYAVRVAQKFPESKTVIVFLTDGEPGYGYAYTGDAGTHVYGFYSCDDLTDGCAVTPNTYPPCVTPDAEVAKVAAVIQNAPANMIYLIGVGDLSATTMNIWAEASGNTALALQGIKDGATVASEIKTELQSIRSNHLSCDIAIPAPKAGGSADPNKVNMDYISGGNAVTSLSRNDNCNSASPTWQYDNPTNPSRILLCPNTCPTVQQDPNGKIQVVLGCPTIQIN